MRRSSDVPDSELRIALRSVAFGFALFVMCLLGIFTRLGGDLANFWPANAFMLGMLIRFPSLKHPLAWLCAALGFVLADLLTGSDPTKAVTLNACNLISIAAGYWVLSRFDPADQKLTRPASVLCMLVATGTASLTAGIIGMGIDHVLFEGDALNALAFWTVGEMVNYIAFLPMLLTLPEGRLSAVRFAWLRRIDIVRALPLLGLVVTATASVLVGGPGAISFPVLALLWCALSYRLFTTTCLSFVFVVWTLLAISIGLLPVGGDSMDRHALLSIRFAVALMSLASLVVASVMTAHKELTQRLLFLSNHDQMTGLLNRTAFLEAANTGLRNLRRNKRPVTALMLDIDHFKSINDRYGHAAGDKVLIAFASLLQSNLRKTDTVGRMGGEEFSVLLDDCTVEQAREIAHRINAAFQAAPVTLDNGEVITATVSIGMMTSVSPSVSKIEQILARADAALYKAKTQGRNRLEVAYNGEATA